jgi:hypothetical protein
MKKIFLLISILILHSCTTKDKYDINRYHTLADQDEVLTSIIAYLFAPPPYVSKQDRLKSEHRPYYSGLTPKFKMLQYYISPDDTHYFYLIRPSSIASEKRGVAGHFKMNKNFSLSEFKEEFVTRVMTEEDLKEKAAFLFDEMVKGNLQKYIGMKDYIQWPNEISYYDTVHYEWTIKPDSIQN